ncbi:MAG: alpha/beta hydrolase [Gammaproteobacteria bacterium]
MAPVILIGNSLGGNVAARLAIEIPDQVRGLVLVSPGGFLRHTAVTALSAQCRGAGFPLLHCAGRVFISSTTR